MLLEPKVSIIVPVWNEEKYLEQCLRSIQLQTYPYFECIIVDDCSTDRSSEIIQRFVQNDSHFKVLKTSKNSGGPGVPLNLGFQQARGQYCTWISGDSWMEPECIDTLLPELIANPNVVMVYSDFWILHRNGHLEEVHASEYDKAKLWRQCYVGLIWLFRTSAKRKAGDFPQQVSEDYYMHLRLSELGDFKRVPKSLGTWRDHENNLTNRVNCKVHWQYATTALAKAKWQSAKYRIAYVCPFYDCAAVGWLLNIVVNSMSDNFAMRHIVGDSGYLGYGEDLVFNRDNDEITTVLDECDIVHFNNFLWRFAGGFDLLHLLKNKASVFHALGGIDQWNKDRLVRFMKEFDCHGLTCTPGHHPSLQWIPCPMPISGSQYPLYQEEHYRPGPNWPRRNDKIKFLCHHNYSPGKGVEQIEAMFKELQIANVQAGPAVQYNRTFQLGLSKMEYSLSTDIAYTLYDHLEYKKNYDVVIDQITHGWAGMASWESMALGSAVICRLDAETQKAYHTLWGENQPPILNARLIDDVAEHVCKLACSRALVNDLGQKGRKWIMSNYTGQQLLPLYEQVYFKALSNARKRNDRSQVKFHSRRSHPSKTVHE